MPDLPDFQVLRYEFAGSLLRTVDFLLKTESGQDVGSVSETPRHGFRRWLPLGRFDPLARHEALMTVGKEPVLWMVRPPMGRESRFDVLDAAKRRVARAIQRDGLFPHRFDVSTPTGEVIGAIESGSDRSYELRSLGGNRVATVALVSDPVGAYLGRPPIYELRFDGAPTSPMRLIGLALAPGIHSILFSRT